VSPRTRLWPAAALCLIVLALTATGAAIAFESSAATESGAATNEATTTANEASDPFGGWRQLVAEGFRAWLPRDETWIESGFRDTYAGVVQEKKYFARAEGRTFSVGQHMLPKLGRFFAPSGLILSHARKNVLLASDGRELSYRRTRIGDYPGALLTFAPKDDDASVEFTEVRLVLAGQRLYVLKASHPEPGADRSAADHFFESFEVLE